MGRGGGLELCQGGGMNFISTNSRPEVMTDVRGLECINRDGVFESATPGLKTTGLSPTQLMGTG